MLSARLVEQKTRTAYFLDFPRRRGNPLTKRDVVRLYEAPRVVVLGSFARSTLQEKKSGLTDGVFLLTVGPLTNASS
jgi:hypothetical protein